MNFDLSLLANNSGLNIASNQTTQTAVAAGMGTGVSNVIALAGGSTIGAKFPKSPWPAARYWHNRKN